MKRLVILIFAVMATMLFTAGNGMAGTRSSTLDLSVELTGDCTVTTGGSIDMGFFVVGGPPQFDVPAGTVTIECNGVVPYDWGIDAGLNGTGYPNLSNGIELMPYLLKVGGVDICDNGLSLVDPSYVETCNAINSYRGGSPADYGGTPETYTLTADLSVPDVTTGGTYTDTVNVIVVW